MLGGILAGGASGLIGGLASVWAADRTNAEARRESRRNRAFQERMSNTSYQRTMDDLRKAGLNPLLAYQQGGASTPGGSQANMVSPDVAGGIEKGVSSAKEMQLLGAEIKKLKSEADLNSAAKLNQLSQGQLNTTAKDKMYWDSKRSKAIGKFFEAIMNPGQTLKKNLPQMKREGNPFLNRRP
jgi:hypothetical protein